MEKCRYYEVCGLEIRNDIESFCILHSTNPKKNQQAFKTALDTHRQRKDHSCDFRWMVFPGETDCRTDTFPQIAYFDNTTFHGNVSFEHAIFVENANFNETTFNGDANFTGAKFAQAVDFVRSTFNKAAEFVGAEFDKSATFCDAKFAGGAFFGEVAFSQESDFLRVIFTGNANFSDARFLKQAAFPWAMFNGYATFEKTVFSEGVDLSDSTFAKDADFFEAIFNGVPVFARASFTGAADFRSAQFSDQSYFGAAMFKQGGDFSHALFSKTVNFTDARFSGPTYFSPGFKQEAIFEQIVSEPKDSLRFISADLSRCRFLGTDVRKLYFLDVRWASIGGRDGVYDEVIRLQPGEQRQWAQIEELYRQLKQNYEERRDYERAGHFHVGEKEMRLRNPSTRIDLRILLALYKGISGYGENYRRPFFWLVVLLLITSGTALVHGLTMKTGTTTTTLLPNSLSDWRWALLYGLETIFHLPSQDFVPQGFGRVIRTTASILGPVLIALFGLALRQRLKR